MTTHCLVACVFASQARQSIGAAYRPGQRCGVFPRTETHIATNAKSTTPFFKQHFI